MERLSKRSQRLSSFIAMDVMEKAQEIERKGQHIIHLEVGEPDFNTPLPIEEATIKAIKDKKTHYTHSLGLFELRETIASHYRREYGVEVIPEQVIITSGTSPVMLLIFSALLDREDEVIISNPHYACYPNFIKYCGGKPVKVPVYEEDGFRFRIEEIEKRITKKTRAILINSPCNPTGTLLSKEDLTALSQLGIPIISDEIYHGLVYGERATSIIECTDKGFVINGFSKLYAMTGWRLGYAILPKEYLRAVQKMQQNFFICAGSFVQYGGIAALTSCKDYVEKMVKIFDERRKFMIKGLKELGFSLKVEPTGAFYVFVNARHIHHDSFALAEEILQEAHVAVTPGIDFGENGEHYLRFSYARSLEEIEEGLRRLGTFLEKRS